MNQTHSKMPSLKALRAFEAAARLNSFTAAGRTLFVTPSAVSHLVQNLEKDLGVALFARNGRKIDLTSDGQRFANALTEAFRIMESATKSMRDISNGNVLTVSMLPSFATKWFAPRLAAFLSDHPDIDLRISAARQLSRFDDGVDAAIRFGMGEWPETESELLFRDEIFPICSPRMVPPEGSLCCPADLSGVTLLHGDIPDDWARWLCAAGLEGTDSKRGPRFNDGATLVQAAIDGTGVALGRTSLTEADLLAGRLVCPFGPSVTSELAYYLVRPTWRSVPRCYETLREWLFKEIRQRCQTRANQCPKTVMPPL